MKSVLLCRVSSKEQEETGYSLPAQEKLLAEYSSSHGFEQKPKIFSISESAGGKKQREIFNSMLAYVLKHNIKVIICEKVDRLTRNFRDAVAINDWLNEDSERQVHFVKENVVLTRDSKSNEKFIWNIKVSVAQYYIDNLSEEVKKGQKEKIAQGWLPTKPPLGYKTLGEKGHKTHIIDNEKSPLIKKLFELYSTGNYSLKMLTELIYKAGLRGVGGNRIYKSRIHELLSDPFYVGKIHWNDKLYEGRQETFIDNETFERVQRVLKGKNTPKSQKHNFLFKSLIRCDECGGLITWEIAKKKHIYGHCNHYRNCSQLSWVKEPEVENQLLEHFEQLRIKNTRIVEWIRKALKESHRDEIEFHSSAVNQLTTRQEQTKQRLDRLYDDKLDGKITEDFYQRKFEQYSQELGEFSDSIKKHNDTSVKYFELGVNIYDLSQKAKEIYLKAKEKNMVEEQRNLIRLTFANLTLNEGRVGFSYTPVFKLLSEAVVATNGSKEAKNKERTDRIFEPNNKVEDLGKTGYFYPLSPTLLALVDYVSTWFKTNSATQYEYAFTN